MFSYQSLDNSLFGHLSGHLVPGTLFFFFGFWWGINWSVWPQVSDDGSRRSGRTLAPATYRARVWYTMNLKCTFNSRVPIEPVLKVVLPVIGIVGEMFGAHWSLYSGDKFNTESINNYSHATMFAFFGLAGVVDLIQFARCDILPKQCGFVALSSAFFIEGMLFYFHLEHERSQLDKQAHIILYTLAFACSAATMLEAWFSTSYIIGLARPYLTILQGSWFYQVAFMLYGPSAWKDKSEAAVLFVPVVFGWHSFIGVVLFILIALSRRRLRLLCRLDQLESGTENDFVSMEQLLPQKEEEEEPNGNMQNSLVQL